MKNDGNPQSSPRTDNSFEQQFSGNSFLPEIPMLTIISPHMAPRSRSPSPVRSNGQDDATPTSSSDHTSNGNADGSNISQLQDRINMMSQRLSLIEQMVYAASYNQMMNQQYSAIPAVVAPGMPGRHRASLSGGEPKTRELDEICLEEFARNPFPNSVAINRMASRLLARHESSGLRPLASSVRKWYRKKRDENGMKIFNSCLVHIQPLVDSGMAVEAIWDKLESEPAIYERILEESRLDVTEPRMALRFLKIKIKSYFVRRVLPPGAAHIGPAGLDEDDE